MTNSLAIKPLVFSRAGHGWFQIGAEAVAIMLSFAQDAVEKREAGGVLLGRHILNSPDIIVDLITTPLSGDQRSRFHFFRARQRHQQQIDRLWRESGGACAYLGEWHTHPQQKPLPSALDLREWRRKLKADTFTDPIFFVIVGTAEVRAWEGHKQDQPELFQLSQR